MLNVEVEDDLEATRSVEVTMEESNRNKIQKRRKRRGSGRRRRRRETKAFKQGHISETTSSRSTCDPDNRRCQVTLDSA